jgi:Spy/CpxP family protein refolding chaperone
MNRFTKKQILIGALVLLFVINLAALGTIIYQNYHYKWDRFRPPIGERDWPERMKEQEDWPRRNGGRGNWSKRPDSMKRKSREEGRGFEYYIKRRLQLDQEQFEKFRVLHRENMESMKEVAGELGQKRDSLMKELTRKDPDSSKMYRLAREIGNLHTRLKENTIDHFTKIKDICRPEQKDELNRMIMEMSRHGKHEPGPGPDPDQKRRQGKRSEKRIKNR